MKEARHQAILRIVREVEIRTQEQLSEELRRAGFDVTQATVSRDIRELGLIKVATPGGEYRYSLPPHAAPTDALGRVQRTFREYVTEVAFSGNLLVLKTLPGSAPVVAAALDELQLPGVVGTVAGDDAVLVVAKDGAPQPASEAARQLLAQFQRWMDPTL